MLARTVLHLFLVATTYPSGIRSRSDGLPFGYSLEDGPLTWAEIPAAHNSSEDWSACRLGKQQSPIVVYTSKLAPLPTGALTLILPPFVSVLENLGTTLEVPAAQQGLLSFRGKSYTLDQFHFHTPSEHRIDDEYFPLEAHFDGTRAVIGVLFQILPGPTTLLDSVFVNLNKVQQTGDEAPTGKLDFSALVEAVNLKPVYNYNGSLTTPPCTEGVSWFVLGSPQSLNATMYNDIKRVMKFNARYSQNAPGEINLLELAREIGNNGTVPEGVATESKEYPGRM